MRLSLLLVLLLVACESAPPATPVSLFPGEQAFVDDFGPPEVLLARLRALPGVEEVDELHADTKGRDPRRLLFTDRPACRAFSIRFAVAVNHDRPRGTRLLRRLFLSHCSTQVPMVYSPDGYGLLDDFFQPEIVERLGANWLWAEHRLYGESLPDWPEEPNPEDDPDAELRTIRQAAADDHDVVSAFKALYPRRWISTGVSKGGMTATFFRRFYPDDVDGTIAYVAPFLDGLYDQRFSAYQDHAGDAACRDKVLAYQRALILRQAELLEHVVPDVPADNHSLQYASRSFRWPFWQYDGDCTHVPAADADAVTMLVPVMGTDHVVPASSEGYGFPFIEESLLELGFPVQSIRGLEDLIGEQTEDDLSGLFPDLTYDPYPMLDVRRWIASEATRIVFVYGTIDPWSGGAATPLVDATHDNLVVWAEGANHHAKIQQLGGSDRDHVVARLSRWADAPVSDPSAASSCSARGTVLTRS